MNLAHIIQQLQEAHARFGNHPNARFTIDAHTAPHIVIEQTIQESDVYLDFSKQTVYLPVTSNNTNP